MGDVERVVVVDISVGVGCEIVEDVGLEGVGRLHNKRIQVQPPEPISVSKSKLRNIWILLTTQHQDTLSSSS